jgi:hypothetical protein
MTMVIGEEEEVMPDGVVAQLFAIAFLHVFPQCRVGIQVGSEHRWSGNGQEVSAEIFYRTIDRVGDKSAWAESDEKWERDDALERRIISFRSHRYPKVRIVFVQCVKS